MQSTGTKRIFTWSGCTKVDGYGSGNIEEAYHTVQCKCRAIIGGGRWSLLFPLPSLAFCSHVSSGAPFYQKQIQALAQRQKSLIRVEITRCTSKGGELVRQMAFYDQNWVPNLIWNVCYQRAKRDCRNGKGRTGGMAENHLLDG